MSFPTTLSLTGETAASFSKQFDDPNSVTYVEDTSAVGLPELLIISHKMSKPALNAVDKHALRYNLTESDEAGKLSVLPISINITKPRQIITETQVLHGLKLLYDFLLTTGNLTKVLRGEL